MPAVQVVIGLALTIAAFTLPDKVAL